MKKKHILIGISAFSLCLWIAAVTTYAAQIRQGVGGAVVLSSPTTCSSSSSSGGAE